VIMNLVTLKGNLTRDVELRYVPSRGQEVAVSSFTLAINRRFKKADGTKNEETTFVDCEAWDTGAELISQYCKKGDPLLLTGALKEDKWEKDGQKHSRMKVRVDTFEFLTRKATPAVEQTEAAPVATGDGESF
jgi:single-strand DNA-binding protein